MPIAIPREMDPWLCQDEIQAAADGKQSDRARRITLFKSASNAQKISGKI